MIKRNWIFGLVLLLTACTSPEDVVMSEPGCLGYAGEMDTNHFQVGFLIMDGVYNTEFTAPYDIFHHTIFRDSIVPMEVFSIAPTCQAVRSFEGLVIQPNFSLEEADQIPEIDILVVPSAEKHLSLDASDSAMIAWVRETAASATYVMSHCDGAFVLAEAGLLEGRVATTFPADRSEMQQRYPNIDVRDSVLFVHDGKFITSVGGAKSFEASLYLCEKLYGKKNADELAEGLVIDWNLDALPWLAVSPQ